MSIEDEGDPDLSQAPHTRLLPHHTPHPQTSEHAAYQFTYWDAAQQNVLFVMAEYGNGERLPWIWSGAEWLQQPPKRPAPLFGLEELARRPDAPVVIVESERSAVRARELLPQQVWVSWPGLGFSHKAVDWTPLGARRLMLWPDANELGQAFGEKMAAILCATAKTVELIRSWEGYHDGWALKDADGQTKGHTTADLAAFAKAHKGPVKPKAEIVEPPTEPVERRSDDPPPDPTEYMPPEASYEAAGEPVPVQYLNGNTVEHSSIAIVRDATDITVTEIEHLWPGVLYIGKPTLVCGDPGLFKSGLTIDIAARVTKGEDWPLGEKNTVQPADVLICSAEDDPSDTIIPRLIAAGADLSKISFIEGIQTHDEEGKPQISAVMLDKHLAEIEHVVQVRCGSVKLLIVDPIAAFLGKTDSHKNSDVRGVLAGLASLAAKYRFAVLVVSHLNKGSNANAIYRISGSLAFVAAARAVFAIVRDPEDAERRLMLAVKNNLSIDTLGFAFRIKVADNDAPYLAWDDEAVTEETADGILGESATDSRTGAINKRIEVVADWLKVYLAPEAKPAATVWRAAKEAGHSTRDVHRAKKHLGIITAPKGHQGAWHWGLPR